jgi:hypothetical protein
MLTGRKVPWDEWKTSTEETIRFYLSPVGLALPEACADNAATFYAQANQNLSRLLSEK